MNECKRCVSQRGATGCIGPMHRASMDSVETTSSHWADLQPDVLVKVSADLSLLDSLHCEKVCTSWRQFAFSRVVGQTKRRTLAISDVLGRSQVCGDSTDSLVQLNIPQHKEGLASWLSMRGAAFDVISFGTALHPAELSLEGWQFVLSAFVQDMQGPQLKLSVASLGFILMSLDERLSQLCTALYIAHGSDLSLEQLVAVSFLTSLQSLEIGLAEDDYMGYLPSCWTRLHHLHSLTLNKCKAVPSVLSTLASLRSLTVGFLPHHPQLCLERLPQLTSLHISLNTSQASTHLPPEFSLLLPKGNDVQLRHLALQLFTFPNNWHCATQLTRLDMAIGAAMSARRQWHAPFSNLKVINFFELKRVWLGTNSYWPTAWQHSTNLERITLGGWLVREIPDWVTKFQQLRCLEMPSAWLQGLSVADLMQLPHLEQLNIGNTSSLVNKLVIVECACLPVLKQLTYGFHHDPTVRENNEMESLSASSLLLKLQAAFASHKFAPFHLRQWESKRHIDVTVVQFSCDD